MEKKFKHKITGAVRWLVGEAAGAGSLMSSSFVVACNEAGDLLVSYKAEFYRTHTQVEGSSHD